MTKHCKAVDRHSLASAVFRGSHGRWTILLCCDGQIAHRSVSAEVLLHTVFAANGS